MADIDAKTDAKQRLAPGPQSGAALAQALPSVTAKLRGKQLLLYQPSGALGGTFTCPNCGATAVQPDLLQHAQDCCYSQ